MKPSSSRSGRPDNCVELGNCAASKLHNWVNHRCTLVVASIIGLLWQSDGFSSVYYSRVLLKIISAFHKSYEQLLTTFIFI